MILAVTAYVPIPGHPRLPEVYHRLAEPLHVLAVKTPLLSTTEPLENCWLYQYLKAFYDSDYVTHSTADNPAKNSLAYHIVQAQKTEFLVDAAEVCNFAPDVYVWIDYGIFHIPGVTLEVVWDFLDRAVNEKAIAIPGCWGPDYVYDDTQPCWRFCGGVMVVPRQYLALFDAAMKQEYVRWLREHHHVSWEVNALARLERNKPDLPIWWYQADHDASMFTNYRATENADGAGRSHRDVLADLAHARRA